MRPLSKGTIQRLKVHVIEGKSSAQVFAEMYKELNSDLEAARTAVSSSDEQFHRRTYLRTLYSYSEAMLFRMKQYLLDQGEVAKVSITPNEKLILDEQKVEMQSDGTLQRKELMTSHKNNIMFTLRFMTRKLELPRQPDFGSNGWNEYCASLEKRNAITHPKFPGDLIVTDSELLILKNADRWVQNEFANLLNNFAFKLREAQSNST